MKRYLLIALLPVLFAANNSSAQQTLPSISVTNYNGKIIIDWKNAYALPVANISIQRSYDSLKNYTTIGSVLNPQNQENGYSDAEPPYNKMYYRVFIAFEGGAYIISPPVRPVKDNAVADNTLPQAHFPWQIDPRTDSSFQAPPSITTIPPPPVRNIVVYPSMRIFTARDNNVVIYLPDATEKKYSVKFFDDSEKKIFELNSLKDEYLIIEKVNFVRAGWFYFELYEDGKLLEKNKFLVPKDGKINNGDTLKRPGNK
jgi:hypothetical protein